MSKVIFVDFEFNRVTHPKVNLVCAATYDEKTGEKRKWWLHSYDYDSKEVRKKLAKYLEKFDVVIAYAAIAEARSFISLGLDPLKWQWIDEWVEYRMLTNHNDKLQYGKQLVDGKVKMTRKPPPKWERTEEDRASGFKPTHSLAEATYKLTGKIRDTEHKTKMRDLIISDPEQFMADEKEAIMRYCLDDVVFLPTIWKRIKEEFHKLDENCPIPQYVKEAKERGRYSVHTAIMENEGYPINVEATKNFSRQIANILFECQSEINDFHPDVKPFRWNKREQRFSFNQKAVKDWILENHSKEDVARWTRTDKNALSLSLEAFEKFYQFKHSYPNDNFGAQMVRFMKLKQSLYGFSTGGKGRKNFWDSVGPDGRVRPYMNIFGAQSSRSQPAATGFIFLKPAWMRSLVQPRKGHFLAGIDYGNEEFFIAALESEDWNMIDAYLSGDPYLHFGKGSGQIPEDGTKATHKLERDNCKNTVLGILFLMTKVGLAIKLTNDSGREWTEEEAQEQIDMFYESYEDFGMYQQDVEADYVHKGFIKLPCGWYMWGDNDNLRSVKNVPIQGRGGSIMRKAVDIARSRGVNVIKTLHDALYMEGKVGEEHKILILRDAMREAFAFYYKDKPEIYKEALKIRLDPFAWSPDYKDDSALIIGKEKYEVPASSLYVDERAIDEYKKFSQYFGKPDFEDL